VWGVSVHVRYVVCMCDVCVWHRVCMVCVGCVCVLYSCVTCGLHTVCSGYVGMVWCVVFVTSLVWCVCVDGYGVTRGLYGVWGM
jgi:hypothetical protein